MVNIESTFGLIYKKKLIILLIMAIMLLSFASARYLPTRNDDYRRERIKDILRMVNIFLFFIFYFYFFLKNDIIFRVFFVILFFFKNVTFC